MSQSIRISAALSAIAVGLALAGASWAQSGSGTAVSIELPGSIDPATEAWVGRALEDAEEDGAELVVIRLDTPGGLDSSMREIVKDVIAAPMPVVVYVSPDGARAASAGLFITQAADVAAMAPQTNIGSASPISISGADIDEVLGRKIENDAAAYVRALSEEHGRNPDLAEEMVREATNVTAEEALDAGLIDVVAADTADLLAQLDGFAVSGPKAQTLDTDGLEVDERDMPFQFDVLQLIVNPNVAFLLILAGVIGLAIEIFSPGLIVPGATGLVSLVIGLFGSSQLPLTATGIVLLVVGVALLIAETQLPTGGIMGILGVVALAISGLLLYDTDSEGFGISAPLVIALAIVAGLAIVFVGRKVVEARHGEIHTGFEELVGLEGDVRVPVDPIGQVFVHGALWRAEPTDELEGEAIPSGARVRVEAVEGLTLRVRPIEEDPPETR
ncbi:MAG: nodulation protein NfeD [Actinomycetota bacterium]|nr:nodulation protein NfeD [Actinomycetota bacterium]